MSRLSKFLALVCITGLGFAVAERHAAVSASLSTPQLSLPENRKLFAQGFSIDVPDSEETHGRNRHSSQPEIVSPEDPHRQGLSTESTAPWLITSPYVTQEHLTNLSTLPLPSRLLTLALTHLNSTNSSYATTPYQHAMNWPIVFEHLRALSASHSHIWTTTIFYVVEFRSRLRTNIDRELLFKLDRESHREATASGGLLKYWFGRTSDDVEGRNLATCLWVKKDDAVAGGKGPWHKQARRVIPKMYESIEVKGLKLTVDDGVSDWKFEPWVETS